MFNVLHILAMITILLFALIEVLSGIVYLLKSPNKLITYRINNLKKRYNIVDEMKYISILGRNNIIKGLLVLILFFISIYYNTNLKPLVAVIFVFIVFMIDRSEKRLLIKKN
ncbi:MAG: hypothetical protein K0R06_3616 [Clostridium sp.]|jgi:hypothetical protein|nr:hypothetical protein [Clostridium sp.]